MDLKNLQKLILSLNKMKFESIMNLNWALITSIFDIIKHWNWILIASILALIVSFRAFLVNSANLKLGLYHKRFDIYASVLELYQSIDQSDHKVVCEKYNAFIKSFRASKFLFNYSDGIYNILEKVNKDGYSVFINSCMSSSEKSYIKLKIHEHLDKLEKKLKKYLQFQN